MTKLWVSLGLGTGREILEEGTGRQGWWGSWRQSWPLRFPRKANLSVELAGGVKRSSTVLPRRWAMRSRTGCGSWREGAWGGPGLAQPARVSAALRAR